MFKVRIQFKDNKIVCCSQVCESNCPNFGKCRTYMIDVKKFRDRKENLSFSYIEKLMSEGGVYKRGKGGALKQIK